MFIVMLLENMGILKYWRGHWPIPLADFCLQQDKPLNDLVRQDINQKVKGAVSHFLEEKEEKGDRPLRKLNPPYRKSKKQVTKRNMELFSPQ